VHLYMRGLPDLHLSVAFATIRSGHGHLSPQSLTVFLIL